MLKKFFVSLGITASLAAVFYLLWYLLASYILEFIAVLLTCTMFILAAS